MFCLIRYEREGLRKVGKKLFCGGRLVWVGLVGWLDVFFVEVGWDRMGGNVCV